MIALAFVLTVLWTINPWLALPATISGFLPILWRMR